MQNSTQLEYIDSMKPLIMEAKDLKKFDKSVMFTRAIENCSEFLRINHIPIPQYVRDDNIDAHGLYIKQPPSSIIRVNVKSSRPPVGVPGFSWTFPGYKADLTVIGITAHETGHHVDMEFGTDKIAHDFKKIAKIESRVSSYEPDVHEAFAETMRMFINNPQLLKEGRPGRWSFITEYVRLKPLHNIPWRTVLKEAHPRLIQAAERWVEHDL